MHLGFIIGDINNLYTFSGKRYALFSALRTVPLLFSRPSEEFPDVIYQILVIGALGAGPAFHYKVRSGRHLGPEFHYTAAHSPFRQIAAHGPFEATAARDRYALPTRAPGCPDANEPAAVLLPGPPDRDDLYRGADTPRDVLRCHMGYPSGAEPGPSLVPSALYYPAPGLRAHALPEPVLPLALSDFRLVRPLQRAFSRAGLPG